MWVCRWVGNPPKEYKVLISKDAQPRFDAGTGQTTLSMEEDDDDDRLYFFFGIFLPP